MIDKIKQMYYGWKVNRINKEIERTSTHYSRFYNAKYFTESPELTVTVSQIEEAEISLLSMRKSLLLRKLGVQNAN